MSSLILLITILFLTLSCAVNAAGVKWSVDVLDVEAPADALLQFDYKAPDYFKVMVTATATTSTFNKIELVTLVDKTKYFNPVINAKGGPRDVTGDRRSTFDLPNGFVPGQADPPNKFQIIYTTNSRLPLDIVVRLTDNSSAEYRFPGVSPITRTVFPLIDFVPQGGQWRAKVIASNEEFSHTLPGDRDYYFHYSSQSVSVRSGGSIPGSVGDELSIHFTTSNYWSSDFASTPLQTFLLTDLDISSSTDNNTPGLLSTEYSFPETLGFLPSEKRNLSFDVVPTVLYRYYTRPLTACRVKYEGTSSFSDINLRTALPSDLDQSISIIKCRYEIAAMAYDKGIGESPNDGRFPVLISYNGSNPGLTVYKYFNVISSNDWASRLGNPVRPQYWIEKPLRSMDQVVINGVSYFKTSITMTLRGYTLPQRISVKVVDSTDLVAVSSNTPAKIGTIDLVATATKSQTTPFEFNWEYYRAYTIGPETNLYSPDVSHQFKSSSDVLEIKVFPLDYLFQPYISPVTTLSPTKPNFQPRPAIQFQSMDRNRDTYPVALSSWSSSLYFQAKIPSDITSFTATGLNIWNNAKSTFSQGWNGFVFTSSEPLHFVSSGSAKYAFGAVYAGHTLSPQSGPEVSSLSGEFALQNSPGNAVVMKQVRYTTQVFDDKGAYDATTTTIVYYIPNIIIPSNRYIAIKETTLAITTALIGTTPPPSLDPHAFSIQFANFFVLYLCLQPDDPEYGKKWTLKIITESDGDSPSFETTILMQPAELCLGVSTATIFTPFLQSLRTSSFYFKLTDSTSTSTYYSPRIGYNPLPNVVQSQAQSKLLNIPQTFGPPLSIIDLPSSIAFDLLFDKMTSPNSFQTGKNLFLSITLPNWVKTDSSSSHCVLRDQENTVRAQSALNDESTLDLTADFTQRRFFVSVGFPESYIPGTSTFSCNLSISLDVTVIPLSPKAMIKSTNIFYHFKTIIPGDFHIERTFSSLDYLHPLAVNGCDGKTYTPCVVNEVPVAPVDVLPPVTPKLPSTTSDLTDCNAVRNNQNVLEKYIPQFHSKMCSIPIAGMLTKRAITSSTYPQLGLSNDQAEYNLCDCSCKGYWIDDIHNNDYKKCSKCAVPNCPALFTPNSECTTCECSTPQCKRFTTNVFGMIYFKPQVLRYIIKTKTNPTEQYSDVKLDKGELSSTLISPSTDIKLTYQDIMTGFANYLKEVFQMASIPTTHTSTISDVVITPLVEGSFTTWKITIIFVNGAQKPLSQLAPLYGLPGLTDSLGSLFGKYFVVKRLFLTSPDAISTTLINHISTSPIQNTASGTTFPLFASDVIKTGCATYEDVQNSLSTRTIPTPITSDMLYPCPLPNQYISAKNNVTKADTLNPLWSKCGDDNTALMKFDNYETLISTTITQTSLRVRQIYPYCFDFTGRNVGANSDYNIACGYANPSQDYLYNTQTSSLILPSYASALLNSFVLPSTTPSSITTRLDYLRNLPQSRFPSFPLATVVLCPADNTTTEPITCPFGKYGDQCQYTNIISPTSMTASPTALEPESHTHVQWDYSGDNTQELTIVLYSTQKKNDGQGYFVWSQLLTTVPVASLYASAQVPTLDQSKLFEMVYDAIANGNNIDLVNIYSSSTNIAIKGYFTRGAQQLINLDQQQIVEQFTFDLPMLCTEFNVSCSHGSSQYCTQNDGRCKCKRGYYDVNPTQERSSSYIIDPNDSSKNIDGSDLTCLPLCQNDGEWDNETSTCKCQDGYNGEYCQVKDDCQVNKSSLCQGDNGYIAFTLLPTDDDSEATTTTTTTPSCQDTKCQCYGHWINQSDAPNTDDLIKKKPKDYVARNNGCSICSLKPINSQFYSPEQLVIINDYYSSNSELSTQYYGNEDTMYTQTYQPTTTTTTTTLNTNVQLHPLTQQRCYITGTQPTTYDDGNCIKCQCKRGYGGDYCQLHIAYANMTYIPIDGNDYIYDKTTEVLLFNKLAEELSLSMNNFDQTQMFVIQHNRDYHWVEIGLYTGLDFFIRNGEYNTSIQQQQQHKSEGYLMSTQQTTTTIPTGFNPTLLPTNLDSLYTQWDDLTTNFPTTPVKNQDTNDYLGPIDPPTIIQDPACFEQEIIGCSGIDERPKRASGHALLIGLVVGLVTAAILFIILVLILLWCKKNQRGFWKSQKEQERDELSNFVPTKTNTFKGSTAAPSMTVGTLSIMPVGLSGNGIEMSSTPATATSVQSVNNHTEVKDATLPPHVKAYKDAKGQVFYVNSETMMTSWNHPNAAEDPTKDEQGDYGAGW